MATRIKGSGILTIAPGDDVEIKPEFFTTAEKHTQFTIGNDSATEDGYMIYLLGDNGKEATPIPAQQAIIVDGDAPVKIKASASNAGDASYVIGQIFGGSITVSK